MITQEILNLTKISTCALIWSSFFLANLGAARGTAAVWSNTSTRGRKASGKTHRFALLGTHFQFRLFSFFFPVLLSFLPKKNTHALMWPVPCWTAVHGCRQVLLRGLAYIGGVACTPWRINPILPLVYFYLPPQKKKDDRIESLLLNHTSFLSLFLFNNSFHLHLQSSAHVRSPSPLFNLPAFGVIASSDLSSPPGSNIASW